MERRQRVMLGALGQIIVASAYRSPPPVGRWFAGTPKAVARTIPPDVPVGVHLCLGKSNNQRVVTPRTAAPIMLLANTRPGAGRVR